MKHDSTAAPPARPPAPTRRHIRRQRDPAHPLLHHPSVLLGHEDPSALQSLRQSVNEELNPQTPYQQMLSEIAVQNVWRALRTAAIETAGFDVQIADQAPQVDRAYEEIDSDCRTFLTLRDHAFARTKRELKNDETVYTRRHFLAASYFKRGKAA